MRTPEQIAIEQRNYWLEVARENSDHTLTQAQPGQSLAELDLANVSPASLAEYWNQQLPGDLRN